MITFKIKFLLAFSPKDKSTKEKKKKKKKEKPDPKKKHVAEAEDPPYVIRLEKSFSVARIEYELIPGKCKYQIDVLCWPNVAKIYTSDGVKIFKIITANGLTFVPICVEHYLKEISTDELVSLQSSVIEFNVFSDKNKLGSMAKANKTEIVYLKETDFDREDFVEAFPEKVNTSGISTKKSMKTDKTDDLEDILLHHPAYQRNEAYSLMHFEENFAEKLYEIIDLVINDSFQTNSLYFKDFVKPYSPDNDKAQKAGKSDSKKIAADKKDKKEGKKGKTEKSPTKLTLQIQGEVFFTDPTFAMFKMEHPKFEVSKFFVILQAESLLTRTQKIYLNPIVIKTMHLSNFPMEIFENTGFTDIYCKYSIPCIAECKTIEKPIDKEICFNESHIYFTYSLSKIKLLEFLESKRLIVEIYGVKTYLTTQADPKLFGEKPSDKDISKIHTKFQKTCLKHEESLKAQDELLAYCSYDLSSLLRNVWDFRMRGQLHNIDNSTFISYPSKMKSDSNEENSPCDFWSALNVSTNSINLAYIGDSFKGASTSLLKEWILIENNTTLSLEAYLLSPQAAALVLHQIPNTFKRLLLIAFERNVATHCFTNILRHNQRIMCQKLKTDDILTGWVLDNGNNIAIYVEGLATGYILNIWQELDSVDVKRAKAFFNTDQAYEKRLYNTCNKWAGFYILTLKVPLEYILKNQKVYIKGNAPALCLKALTKFNLLFYTGTLKRMMQYELLPTTEELISLDMEYGVPYGWKGLELSDSPTNETQEDTLTISN